MQRQTRFYADAVADTFEYFYMTTVFFLFHIHELPKCKPLRETLSFSLTEATS